MITITIKIEVIVAETVMMIIMMKIKIIKVQI